MGKWARIVKRNANYTCQECGSTDLVQAHDPTGEHTDIEKGICLCASCHADKHPDLPRELFLSKPRHFPIRFLYGPMGEEKRRTVKVRIEKDVHQQLLQLKREYGFPTINGTIRWLIGRYQLRKLLGTSGTCPSRM